LSKKIGVTDGPFVHLLTYISQTLASPQEDTKLSKLRLWWRFIQLTTSELTSKRCIFML